MSRVVVNEIEAKVGNDITFNDTLRVDTIVDKAGTGGTNVKIGNTSTYISDGGGVTQNTVQGLCKSWINFDGTGTIAISDSHNVTSITDDGTALYTVTIANDMANSTYALTVIGDDSGSRFNTFGYAEAYAVGSFQIRLQDDQSSSIDTDIVGCTVHGDLA